MKHFFFSESGKAYLTREYVEHERSTYCIAAENETYATLVRRALVFHGLQRRDKSKAQKAALKSGRHDHPTAGRVRTEEEKKRIGDAVRQARREKAGRIS